MNRLLIAGFGDIARRAAPSLEDRFAVRAIIRDEGMDLDQPSSLAGLGGADAVLHCAPPPSTGHRDTRTANLLAALERNRILPTRFVYISTSGVYGDCRGARVDESWPCRPQTPRAARRVDAESQLALWCNTRRIALVVLRAPGIYAANRLPLDRLRAGTPVLRAAEDVYTNHIHADDLAACCIRALESDAPAGIFNACDDSNILMGDWMDLVADHAGLPRPPRIARAEAASQIPSPLLSFMSESRRLANTRLKQVLGFRLRFPTVHEGLRNGHPARLHQPA